MRGCKHNNCRPRAGLDLEGTCMIAYRLAAPLLLTTNSLIV
jgi:hypothetical protein